MVVMPLEMLGQTQDLVWGYQPLQESTGAILPKVPQKAMDCRVPRGQVVG